MDAAPETTTLRALLIGIDSYAERPLRGCVNDIDCAQSFLMTQLGVPAQCIRRLEAPPVRTGQLPIAAERQPTYDNLVAELRALAGPQVQRGDRIFIYYAGHGSYEKIARAQSYFEGLVPIDHQASGLLFDVELNGLLQAIAARSGDLTVILDCCYSAGATRDVDSPQSDQRVRFLPRKAGAAGQVAGIARLQRLGADDRPRQTPAEYSVLAACHADEVAAEYRQPGGQTRGLLSYFLFDLLAKVDKQRLGALTWSDIWDQLKSSIRTAQPRQCPMLLGPRERRVFGGPWAPASTGQAIRRPVDDGKKLAFSSAGTLAALRVAVSLTLDSQLRGLLEKYAVLDELILLPEDDLTAEARVGQYDNGDLWIGDNSAGPGPSLDPRLPGPLGRVCRADFKDVSELAVGLRAALAHYSNYVIPLRFYRNGGFTLPDQAVRVRLLDCAGLAEPAQLELDATLHREVRRDDRQRCFVIDPYAPVAIHIQNTLNKNLYVFLLLCSLEGQVQLLDGDVLLRGLSGKIFWFASEIGTPFQFCLPEGCSWGIDRLIVVATNAKGADLQTLQQVQTMNERIRMSVGSRSFQIRSPATPTGNWMATQTLIQIGNRDSHD